jgi:hypothetical protein
VKSRKKLIASLAVIVSVLFWYFFVRKEARMIREARAARTASDVKALYERYKLSGDGFEFYPYEPGPVYKATYQSRMGNTFINQKSFAWVFDDAGKVKEFGSDTYIQCFGWVFSSSD